MTEQTVPDMPMIRSVALDYAKHVEHSTVADYIEDAQLIVDFITEGPTLDAASNQSFGSRDAL